MERRDDVERVEAGPRLVRVDEAASRLALSVRSVRALISAGRLPFVRVGERRIAVDAADLARFVAERKSLEGR